MTWPDFPLAFYFATIDAQHRADRIQGKRSEDERARCDADERAGNERTHVLPAPRTAQPGRRRLVAL
jgi:hypothetical protein